MGRLRGKRECSYNTAAGCVIVLHEWKAIVFSLALTALIFAIKAWRQR
jgi:hypothetical protein